MVPNKEHGFRAAFDRRCVELQRRPEPIEEVNQK